MKFGSTRTSSNILGFINKIRLLTAILHKEISEVRRRDCQCFTKSVRMSNIITEVESYSQKSALKYFQKGQGHTWFLQHLFKMS